MSFDKYSDKAAEAIALIREFAKVEYWDFFKGDPEQALEAFCAMQDAAEEMGRIKAQDSAAPQDNVPGVSELPPLPERDGDWAGDDWFTKDTLQEYARTALIARDAAVTELNIERAVQAIMGGLLSVQVNADDLRAALRAYGQRAEVGVPQWISVKDRLPSPEVLVMVYVPETKYEHADIRFDCIDPNDDDHASWLGHNEHYEHFCVVGKPEGSIGPSADAPYTHWMPLPAAPGAAPSQPHNGQRAAVPEGQRIWILMNESDEEPVMFYTERPSETFKSHMKLKEFMLFDPSELPTGRPAWEYYFTHSSATGRSDTEVGPCLTYDKAQAFGVGCSRQRELVISAPSQPQQEAVPAEQSEPMSQADIERELFGDGEAGAGED